MQLCHTSAATSAVFDDPNLVSSVGLVPVLALARSATGRRVLLHLAAKAPWAGLARRLENFFISTGEQRFSPEKTEGARAQSPSPFQQRERSADGHSERLEVEGLGVDDQVVNSTREWIRAGDLDRDAKGNHCLSTAVFQCCLDYGEAAGSRRRTARRRPCVTGEEPHTLV